MQFDICPGCMHSPAAPGVCPVCGFDSGSYSPKPHHLPLYTILDGKYLVGKVLGEGGFGITYLGWDMTLEVKVAIKEYCPAGYVNRQSSFSTRMVSTGAERAEELFVRGKEKSLQEARIMAKCDSIPEIVRVRDFFEANNTVYIIMDFIEGVTLKRHMQLRGGRLSMNECISLLGPVMRAMDTVHKQFGLIHRDISPDNIMIQPDGRVRILDFGAAKSAAAPQSHTTALMLKRGLSPLEQYSDSSAQGPWTDVYAMGATIYYCLTATLPPEATARAGGEMLIPPVHKGAVITRGQEAALMRSLALHPSERFQSMADFYRALITRPQAAPTAYTRQPQPVPQPAAPQVMQQPTAVHTVQRPAAPAPAAVSAQVMVGQRPQPVQVMPPVQPAKKKGPGGIIAAIAASLVLLAALGFGASYILGREEDKSDDRRDSYLEASRDNDDEEEDERRDDSEESDGLSDESVDIQLGADTADPDSPAADGSMGHRTNNLVNGNFFFDIDSADYEYTLYYSDCDFVSYLENDDGVLRLNDGASAMFLNYAGDGLYFVDYPGYQSCICRTDPQGGNKTVLHRTAKDISYLTYYDGWLYFIEGSSSICRIGTDGESYETLVTGGEISIIACYEGNIYWLDENAALCTVPVEGGEARTLYGKTSIYFFQFYNDRIYCVRDEDIIVLGTDGRIKDNILISTYHFNIYNDVMYYADYVDHGIYSYDLADGEVRQLAKSPGGRPGLICAGHYGGRVTLWFLFTDSRDVTHAAILVEDTDSWAYFDLEDIL